jgi:hypothetical protein
VIGLSLSLCVADIIAGKVDFNDVRLIIAGTKAATAQQWADVMEMYAQNYWRKDPNKGIAVATLLLAQGKVQQNRLLGWDAPSNLGSGHWINANRVEQLTNKQREKAGILVRT